MNTETGAEAPKPWRYEEEATGLAAKIHNDLFAMMKGVCGEAWDLMTEFQQEQRIDRLEKLSQEIVSGVVAFVADGGFEHVPILIGKFTYDELIKGQYETPGFAEHLTAIAMNQGREALIVFASAKQFTEKRSHIRAAPDQPGLPIEGEDEDDGAPDEGDSDGVDPVAAAAQAIWDEEDGPLRVPPEKLPDVPEGYEEPPAVPAMPE